MKIAGNQNLPIKLIINKNLMNLTWSMSVKRKCCIAISLHNCNIMMSVVFSDRGGRVHGVRSVGERDSLADARCGRVRSALRLGATPGLR